MIVGCSQSRRGKFFSFYMDSSYGCVIHPIDLQHGLLRNTLFFMPVALKDLLHFWKGGGKVHQCRNLIFTCYILKFKLYVHRGMQTAYVHMNASNDTADLPKTSARNTHFICKKYLTFRK